MNAITPYTLTPNDRLLLFALDDVGVQETPGSDNNPEIMAYMKEAGHSWVNSEETPWCSAFMNAICRRAGLPSTGSLRARSWLDVQPNATHDVEHIDRVEGLETGDLVILWRESRNSAKGHIAQFVSRQGSRLYLLGGNQNNSVCIKSYPQYRFLAGKRFH